MTDKSQVFHILNGDVLAKQLENAGIKSEFIVFRESLVEGPVNFDSLQDFWKARSEFIADTYYVTREVYYINTVMEFDRVLDIPNHSEVCLWFENDLFCQANMWFVISILSKRKDLQISRVFPQSTNSPENWFGFGNADADSLKKAHQSRILFDANDIRLGVDLWNSYCKNDFEKLKTLSMSTSGCFAHLEEVCQAQIDRFPVDHSPGRPEKTVRELIVKHPGDFQKVYAAFSEQEGIYGFGDLQLKTIYDRQLSL